MKRIILLAFAWWLLCGFVPVETWSTTVSTSGPELPARLLHLCEQLTADGYEAQNEEGVTSDCSYTSTLLGPGEHRVIKMLFNAGPNFTLVLRHDRQQQRLEILFSEMLRREFSAQGEERLLRIQGLLEDCLDLSMD
ncbi:MAG: hypothetical protein Tsb002_09460 [Wenzhouxiangellaceae bacterium]